jgi:F0F1-type ATP synthase assembly protein I
MAVAAEMAVPILLGAWIDRWLGTKSLFAILGGVFGVTVGVWSLVRMVEPIRRRNKNSGSREPPRERQP